MTLIAGQVNLFKAAKRFHELTEEKSLNVDASDTRFKPRILSEKITYLTLWLK